MAGLRALLGAVAFFALGATAALCAEVPIPASPTQWVTDTAGFLSPQTVDQLNTRLRSYEKKTGHQVLVYVAPTTGQTPLEDWTVRAFKAWKVGRKGLDDGLVLFIFPSDRKLRIEVGYGLEATVPDATAARIIRDTITPDIRAGQPDRAVIAGVDGILGVIGGEAPQPAGSAGAGAQAEGSASEPLTAQDIFVLLFAGLVVLVLVVVTLRWAARLHTVFIGSGRGHSGGGGFFGGGFSGGGFSGGGFGGGGGSAF